MNDLISLSSVIPAVCSLYGVLFGFTFIIIQQFLSRYPYWMIKNVWKNVYFIIFILLYPLSLIAYIFLLSGAFPQKDITILILSYYISLQYLLFVSLFVIDVIYPVLYVMKMIAILHPDFILKLVCIEISNTQKEKEKLKIVQHIENALMSVESLIKENAITPRQFHYFVENLKSTYFKKKQQG